MVDLNDKYIEDLFEIVKGKGSYFEKCSAGNTPLISASSLNNGVIGFVDIETQFKAPCITIERVGAKAHVQTTDFATVPDDIFVLIPKFNFSIDELFFIAAVLNVNRWRFSYSHKVTIPRLKRISFNLDEQKNTIQILVKQKKKQKRL